jgi:archaellum component FlaC
MNKLEKLHTEVKKLEEHYEDCSAKANNIQAMMLHSAEASAFTRVRWMIESMMEVEDEYARDYKTT